MTIQKIEIDPVTFEVLRHRMWAINDEAAATVRLVSGSPVANEAYDYNTALLTEEGDVFTVGVYIAIHAISLEQVVKYILAEYKDNPGINEDDMFLCNDPYVGAVHQNDVTLVAPVHWKGELIGWTGAAIHQVDVGGPGKGQVSIGATSIFEEAPVIPPLKIVEKGTTRKDIEAEYLKRSRTPDLLALDLRAMVASNNVAKKRIRELVDENGLEVVKAVMKGILDNTEARLRNRLKELPDGAWRHISYLDYQDEIYACKLEMTKEGGVLAFDFRGTSPQAPAVINCTYAGLRAGLLTTILAYLCYDIGWCPTGAMRCVNLISEEGTVVHSKWPAGTCKATTAGNWAVINVVSTCLAKMLAASDKYRNRLMAPWKAASLVEELFGTNQYGASFGATILDFMAGGGGARANKDGIDTGGFLCSISCAIADVETYESRYPILYLYRKQVEDTGGPGKFRGGVALGAAYTAHDVDEIAYKVVHSLGQQQPEAVGIYGGYPGSTNQVVYKRSSNVQELFSSGKPPANLSEVSGELEIRPSISATRLKREDVYAGIGMGGGGYGDPLERDVDLVARDLVNNCVSLRCARDIYGVVIDPVTLRVDIEKTRLQRLEVREERKR